MFDLADQALAIKAILDGISTIETVAYIDQDAQSMRQPATLPAAFIALDKIKGVKNRGRSMLADVGWTIVVRSKRLTGAGGCLDLIDLIVDALEGFSPGAGAAKLALVEIEYFDQQAESIAYAIKFSVNATGDTNNAPCQAVN